MDNKSKNCLGCGYGISKEDRYCPQCGLITKYRNLSVKYIIKSFFDTFLNFDLKMFRSIRDIWVPNKITRSFLEGKREYHVHPFRFYFICLVLFFALLSYLSKDMQLKGIHQEDKVRKYELYLQLDSLSSIYSDQMNSELFDTLKKQLYSGTKQLDKDTFFTLNFFGTDLGKYCISTMDAYSMGKDSLYSKYRVEDSWDKYAIAQYQRLIKDPESAIRFSIANMIWGLILLTVIIAFALSILYIRHESYYIEHLLHIANYHCLNLILFSLLMLAYLLNDKAAYGAIGTGVYFAGILYLGYSLHQYYSENPFITFLKLLILGFFYFIAIFIIIALIFFLSMILY